jgi:hypothetical protein
MTSLDSIFYQEQGTVVVMIKNKCRHDYDSQVFRIERRVRIQPQDQEKDKKVIKKDCLWP